MTYRNSDEKTNIWKEMCEGISFVKNQKHIALVLIVIALTRYH